MEKKRSTGTAKGFKQGKKKKSRSRNDAAMPGVGGNTGQTKGWCWLKGASKPAATETEFNNP